jgi:hypothetical protein
MKHILIAGLDARSLRAYSLAALPSWISNPASRIPSSLLTMANIFIPELYRRLP